MRLFFLTLATAAAADLTGKAYTKGERVPLLVDSLVSDDFGVISYYDLPFCTPPEGIHDIPQHIVEILLGHKLQNSPYEIFMRQEETCKVLCAQNDTNEWAIAKTAVQREFRARYFTEEGLPALPGPSGYFGTPIGTTDENGTATIRHHLSITLMYYPKNNDSAYIVGLRVEASPFACNDTWSYEVHWEESKIRWASRLDAYADGKQVDMTSVIYSMFLVAALLLSVSGILTRTVRRDLLTPEENEEEDSPIAWKNLGHDVFRPVSNSIAFADIIGSGTFLLILTITVLAMGAFSIMFIADRGWFFGPILLWVVIAAFLGGTCTGLVYQSASLRKDKGNLTNLNLAYMTGHLSVVPLVILMTLREEKATDFFALLAIWLSILLPPMFLGVRWGNRERSPPLPFSEIPRQIPLSRPIARLGFAMFYTGLCTCFVFLVQLYHVLNSLWYGHVIVTLAFVLLTFLLTLMTASLSTIVFCYLHLQEEDYRWRWRSVFTSGSGAICMFISCCLWAGIHVHEESRATFLVYSLVFSCIFFLCTSVVGYCATSLFVHYIYAQIKLD